jgi:hypothetical protein
VTYVSVGSAIASQTHDFISPTQRAGGQPLHRSALYVIGHVWQYPHAANNVFCEKLYQQCKALNHSATEFWEA